MAADPFLVDLMTLATKPEPQSGPVWGQECEDLDMTLLVWQPGQGIAEHVNDEVDVLIVALSGEAKITINDQSHTLGKGQAVLIPKSTRRSVTAGEAGFSHLNVHRRRKRLMPGLGADAWRNRARP